MLAGTAAAGQGPAVTPGKVANLAFKADRVEVHYYLFVPKGLTSPAR